MEDEVDVDIEGDAFDSSISEIDGGGLIQEQFLQSTWKSSAGILPWELDNSISAENREVIEKMLLEEQYYLTGQEIPQNFWQSETSKPKVKKSPTKTASTSSSRWSAEEKKLFEDGLAQYGRRWTKIAKLVGSRTVLQVKSFARQYLKHEAKSKAAAPSTGPMAPMHPQSTSNQPHPLANAVRIEKLSDDEDEEIDITDDDNEPAEDKPSNMCKSEATETEIDDFKQEQEDPDSSIVQNVFTEKPSCSLMPSDVPTISSVCTNMAEFSEQNEFLEPEPLSKAINEKDQCYQFESSEKVQQPEEQLNENTEYSQEDDEEGEELKPPHQEIEMDLEVISEDEKQAIPEFFEGRPSKTPERYLKIRNYILDQWSKSKPKYLNKTSVRPGLKNCGDVNCIGRIHTYLELVGAINFNCEQAVYNRPRVVDRTKQKESKDVLEAYQLAQRLQSMRTRKRRVRDIWGNWCDAKDLEGQTYEHLSAEELAKRREEMKNMPKPSKMSRFKGSFDPFKLIPCRTFGDDVQEPFQIIVCAETLLIMDMHAHVSRGEVIGLLGGTYNEEDKILKISVAEPCNSVSTGMQCEMDPVSQTLACDTLSSLGLSVVGWYHSHPSFHPNPSVRDIHTQDQFQSYFSRGGAPFIGMIVSPYDPANPSPHSQTTCLLVKETHDESISQKMPYKFDFLPSQDIPNWDQTLRRAQWIIQKYSQTPGSVQMNRFFRRDSHLTCLEKMLSSLAKYLEPLPDDEGDPFLIQIQALFQSLFLPSQKMDQAEGHTLNVPSELLHTDDSDQESLPGDSDQESKPSDQTETTVSEVTENVVLHLGSVLSTEHDYLL